MSLSPTPSSESMTLKEATTPRKKNSLLTHEVALVPERRDEGVRGPEHHRRRHHDGLDAQGVAQARSDGVDEGRGSVVGDDLGQEAGDLSLF